jgi:uncharacterized protein (DUF362 family)
MPIVYWSKTSNRREFVTKVLEAFQPQIESAATILVKPNVVSSEPCPTTTHPETLDAVLGFLSGKDVVVSDAPAIDARNPQRVMADSPLRPVCEAHGVPFTNMYKCKTTKLVTPRGYALSILTLPLERDYVISLPVLKTHNVCRMTGALKNQFGYLPRRERAVMHLGVKDIHRAIAELNVVAKPDLIIVDVVQSLCSAQELRHGGSLVEVGYMLAGSDPVALDCFGLELLREVEPSLDGASPQDVLTIRYAVEYGVGSAEFKGQEVVIRGQ